jgi:uncharacterized protein YcbX
MPSGREAGSVTALWRFPVKSMLGERLASVEVDEHGLRGDRAYALIDVESGNVITAKKSNRFPGLFGFSARYAEAPVEGSQDTTVVIQLPDGNEVYCTSEEIDDILSALLGRAVRLSKAGGGEIQPAGRDGSFHDLYAVSVLSNSTLDRMNELQPGSLFDARRFRMNLMVDSHVTGFPASVWGGRTLAIGESLGVEMSQADARCVMTTLAQEDLPEDRAILTGLAKHNRLQIGEKGRYPCAGVYARVSHGGQVKVGDPVMIVEA